MRRIFILLAILVILFISSICWSGWFKGSRSDMGRFQSGGGATDYTSDANCMAAYYMNGNGGNETDRSGEGETLTETGGTIARSATVPSGYSGNSRDIVDGDTEYFTHADGGSTDIFGADQCVSIVAWVRIDAISTNAYQGAATKYHYTDNNRQYALGVKGDGLNANEFAVWGAVSSDGTAGNTTTVYSTTDDIAVGSWHHIAMVYNDTDLRVYLDGSLDCTPGAHTAGISEEPSVFLVGQAFEGDYDFDGLIDEVAVFNDELTSTEINNIYTDGISGDKGGSD